MMEQIKTAQELRDLCSKNKSMVVLFWFDGSSASILFKDAIANEIITPDVTGAVIDIRCDNYTGTKPDTTGNIASVKFCKTNAGTGALFDGTNVWGNTIFDSYFAGTYTNGIYGNVTDGGHNVFRDIF